MINKNIGKHEKMVIASIRWKFKVVWKGDQQKQKQGRDTLQNLHFAPKYQCHALNQLETNWNKKFVWRAKISVKAKIISHITTRLVLIITLCLLSRFSRVRLFASLWTVARQAPLSMGLSRQEHCCHALLQGIFPTLNTTKLDWSPGIKGTN